MALQEKNLRNESQPFVIKSRRSPRASGFFSKPPLAENHYDIQKIKRLFRAVNRGSADEVKALIEKEKLDPNVSGKWGDTLLMMASARGYWRTVKILIENGADPNIKGKCGITPLMLAVKWSNSVKTIEVLLEGGTRVRTRNMLFGTALGDARWSNWLPRETMEKLEQKWIDEGIFYKIKKLFSGIKEFFSEKFFGKKAEA
jgi:hypothetical protein